MEDIKVIREEFKKYLYKQVADNKLSKVDADTQYSDADYIRKHEDDLLISYYSIFISNERFEQALLNLKKQFQNQGKSDSTFYAYKRALNSYKMFFEEYIKEHTELVPFNEDGSGGGLLLCDYDVANVLEILKGSDSNE